MAPVDLRPYPERISAELAGIKALLEALAGRMTRLEHSHANLTQRFERLSQIQGMVAIPPIADDLEMEPGVRVWAPVEIDEDE